MRSVLAGVLSGILLVISFPRPEVSLAAWVALVPLLYQMVRSTPRQGLVGGAALGITFHLGNVYWTSEVMTYYGGLSPPVAIAALLALVGYLALFTTCFGGLSAAACRLGGPAALFVTPVLWVGIEAFRVYPFGGFPWCLLGYSQVGVPPVLQIASITGIHGVSFLVALVNALFAYWLSGPGLRRAAAAGAPVAALVTGVIFYGERELRRPLVEETAATFPVAAVQGNVLQSDKWNPGYADRIFADHMRLTARAAAEGARLIVWPESSTPFHFDARPDLAGKMRSLAREDGVYLLFGSDDYEVVSGDILAYNGAKLITPQGDVTLRYRKIVLVPFGEYVPMQSVLFFAESLVEEVSNFSAGSEVQVASVDDGTVGAFICYEAIYPDLVRRFVIEGAELLVNLTNDAWFGRSAAPYQHLQMAVARAVETRRYLVRAANTGISAIIDPYGRVLARSDLFVQQVVSGKVSFLRGQTFFVRHGNVVARATGLVTVVFALGVIIRFGFRPGRRRHGRPAGGSRGGTSSRS